MIRATSRSFSRKCERSKETSRDEITSQEIPLRPREANLVRMSFGLSKFHTEPLPIHCDVVPFRTREGIGEDPGFVGKLPPFWDPKRVKTKVEAMEDEVW